LPGLPNDVWAIGRGLALLHGLDDAAAVETHHTNLMHKLDLKNTPN
jgi:hypothetical protein